MAAELALAGEVQASFLPRQVPEVPGWELSATLKPAREASGDFYDFASLPDGQWGIVVADVVYNPPGTWLIRQADQRGCKTIDGLTLYIEQTAQAFETWTAADADRQTMREAVEEFLVL